MSGQYGSYSQEDGKIQICINYRDLNAAYAKDEFPLLITDVVIDNTCGFERMSFMDDFSGYNQIKMYNEDEKHTSFTTSMGVYCYTVIHFGLKNTSVINQHAINAIFHEHIRKIVQCYVDDIIMKSRDKGDYLVDLRECSTSCGLTS